MLIQANNKEEVNVQKGPGKNLKIKFDLDSQPSSDSSMAKVAILQATGLPKESGFPSTFRQTSGTKGYFEVVGDFFETLSF